MSIAEIFKAECPACHVNITVPMFKEMKVCDHMDVSGAVVFVRRPEQYGGGFLTVCTLCEEVS